jgi:hypothetical protein
MVVRTPFKTHWFPVVLAAWAALQSGCVFGFDATVPVESDVGADSLPDGGSGRIEDVSEACPGDARNSLLQSLFEQARFTCGNLGRGVRSVSVFETRLVESGCLSVVECTYNQLCFEGFLAGREDGFCEDADSDTQRGDIDVDADVFADVEVGSDIDAEAFADDGSGVSVDVGDDTETDSISATDSDPGVDTTAGPDIPCIPEDEVCDDRDNDCDGIADNGVYCGGGGCLDGMVEIIPSSGDAFCIDIYEASRADATATAEGADTTTATSRANVLPWRFVPYDDADDACRAAGKRLCEATEWLVACGGSEGWSYPYGERLYNGSACNGLNTPPLTGPEPTGQFEGCESPYGIFDLSGNLSEWTTNRFPIGGAYDDVSQNLRCNSEDRVVNPVVSEPQAGFRCCRTP